MPQEEPEAQPVGVGLRVLCLHDAKSNATALKEQLKLLGDKLYKHHGGIDFVYVNSPLVDGTATDSDECRGTEAQERSWWVDTRKYKNNKNTKQQPHPYHGLDASLLLLRQVWTNGTTTPFWGIMGIGQGAAMAALLSLTLQADISSSSSSKASGVVVPPCFCIFIAGQTVFPERHRLVDESILPCLHIVPTTRSTTSSKNEATTNKRNQLLSTKTSTTDREEEVVEEATATDKNKNQLLSTTTTTTTTTPVPMQQHELLMEQFGGIAEYCSSSSNILATLNCIGRFLCHQKRRLLQHQEDDNSNALALALQTALYQTEHEASTLIANYIAKQPPKPLMAVIQPSRVSVGGWNREQEKNSGGGAPCPSEFVLKRNQRKQQGEADNGPSREHPGASK